MIKKLLKTSLAFIMSVSMVLTMIPFIPSAFADEIPGPSDEQEQTVPAVPQISGVTCLSDGTVRVVWAAAENAESYEVYRSSSASGSFVPVATTPATGYTDRYVKLNTKYYYKVCSIRKVQTEEGEITLKSALCAANASSPVKLQYVRLEKINKTAYNRFKLQWTRSPQATGYYVYRKAPGSDFKKIATIKTVSGLTYTDKSFICNKNYSYKIIAYYSKGTTLIKSSASNTLSQISKYVGKQTLNKCIYYFGKDYKCYRKVNGRKKMICLTYDDGPAARTKTILATLKKYNQAATFFVVGSRVSKYKSTIKKAHKQGCEIGNHTYSHPMLTSCSYSRIKSQIGRTKKAIKRVTGSAPKVMRPPYGAFNRTVRSTVGTPLIYWSIDTRDWATRSSRTTIRRVLNGARNGSIVLMHDSQSSSATASKTIIPKLVKKGYQLVTISEMAELRSGMKKGKVYYKFYK